MNRRVVITAAGVVSPLGDGLDRFTDNLMAGRSGIRRLGHLFGDAVYTVEAPLGAPVLDEGMSAPAEPEEPHRSVRFAERAIAQIVEATSGVDWSLTPLHCGVGIGQQLPEVAEVSGGRAAEWREDLIARLGRPRAGGAHARLSADFGTNWLRGRFGLAPAPQTFVGACAAAAQACIQAIEDVTLGASAAIGGAHDSLLSTLGLYVMHGLGTLAPPTPDVTGAVRPFDVSRDGTLIGEGACYLLFEERQSAIARGAEILAEVVGHGSSLDGYHITSPDPCGAAGVRMIRQALDMAGLDPGAVDYVNAHGTGTLANDQIESKIIKTVFADHTPVVGSSKPQFGHLIAACGAIELLACVAALQRQQIPPSLNCRSQDPECDIRVAGPGAEAASLSHVLCNSFGFGGQNACVLLSAPR